MTFSARDLETFGLSEKEAAVYTAALQLGAATADQIATASGIKRSTTYLQIEQLQEKGLMSSFEQGKKTLFTPESPENLDRLIEKQKKDLELKQDLLKKQLPGLTSLFEGAGERPVVRFYQGKEGIIALREEILRTKNKVLHVMSSNNELANVFTLEEREEYSKRRSDLGIKTRFLYSRKEGKISDSVVPLISMAYLPSEKININTDIVIFDDSIAILSLKNTPMGVLIKSKDILVTHNSIFELLWSIAEKH